MHAVVSEIAVSAMRSVVGAAGAVVATSARDRQRRNRDDQHQKRCLCGLHIYIPLEGARGNFAAKTYFPWEAASNQ